MIYIAVLCNLTELLQNHSTILPLFIGPYAAATVRRFSMKALARYQVTKYVDCVCGLAGGESSQKCECTVDCS